MKMKAKFEQGNCLRLMGKVDDSIKVLREAVEMKAENPEVQNSLGLSLHENKQYEDAINCYAKAITYSQHETSGKEEDIRKAAQYFSNKGLSLMATGNRLEEAFSDHNDAIALNPNNPSNYYNRGNVLYRKDQFEQALEDYD